MTVVTVAPITNTSVTKAVWVIVNPGLRALVVDEEVADMTSLLATTV